MDEGVKFVFDNFNKTIELCRNKPVYHQYLRKVMAEYYRIKAIKYTGNMIDYFNKFKDNKNKYANTFTFLKANGILPNEDLSVYLAENYSCEVNNRCGIQDFVAGKVYTNQEICVTFGVTYMGGMRKSNLKKCLVLIAKHDNPLYDDQWTEDGVMNYTGMGKVGNQDLSFFQNKTLKNSRTNGIKVYLFEAYKDNEYYYDGEVYLDGAPYTAQEVDELNEIRTVYKFPLRRVDGSGGAVVKADDVKTADEHKRKVVQKKNLDEIANKAKAEGTSKTTVTIIQTTQRNRNQYVEAYTKLRANGVCDLCGYPGPFQSKGKPYLESHHVIFLADGGPDAIYNTVALCPNCHRKMHVINDPSDKKKLVKKIEHYLLADKDKASLAEFKKVKF